MLRISFFLFLAVLAPAFGQIAPLNLNNFPVPTPEPTLPAGVDTFQPPHAGNIPPVGAPAVAEWTHTGGPDDVIAMTGSNFTGATGSLTFQVFGKNSAGPLLLPGAVLGVNGSSAAVVLSAALPSYSEYLIWPRNAAGLGAPVAINGTEAWWIGPNAATRGQTVSVYGRNLMHDPITSASYIYILQAGNPGVWATVTAVNPYKVDFTVPSGLADGNYQVWVHNGRGGHYGWSGPLMLTINDGMPWTTHIYNVMAYGAKGDGITDDQAAIESALEAAAKDPWSTIYMPTGTYTVSLGFVPPSQVRWMGDGPTKTILRANANFGQPSTGWTSRAYCLLFNQSGYNNIEVKDLTIDANGNMKGYLQQPVYLRGDTDVRLIDVTIAAKGYNAADFHGTTRLLLQDCTIISTGIFFGAASQVVVDSCQIYGTNDANTLLTSWGGDSLSFTNTTAQDYDNTTSDGWAKGRFIYGATQWGSNRNIYIGDCVTKALEVRPAAADQNSGEQLLWENGTLYSGQPTAATNRTVTFGANAFFSDAGLAQGHYDAVVVNGTGVGQHRKIVACAGSTVTVMPAWNVTPDGSSTVTIGTVVSHCAIYHNTLQGKSDYATHVTASAGIQPYGDGFDFIADSNTISQVRTGIALWCPSQTTVTPQSVNPVFFNYVANNTVTNCLTGIEGISIAWNGWPASSPYPGLSFLGNMITSNSVLGVPSNALALQASQAPLGDQFEYGVFAHNKVTNTAVGLMTASGGHVNHTILYKNSLGAGGAVSQ